MYGYNEHLEIRKDHVLQKVSEKDIFNFAFGYEIDFDSRHKSPFRVDDNAGCFFSYNPNAGLVFVDYTEDKNHIRRDCFNAVMERYGLSLKGAIRKICDAFNLSTSSDDYQPVQIIQKSYEEEKKDTVITYDAREFTKQDKRHWSQFLITTDNLIEDHVHSISSFRIQSSKKNVRIINYGLAYAIDFIDAVKINQPYSKDYRYITNCNENHIGNIDNLPATGDELIIAAGYKDHRVIRNVIKSSNVVWFHNEGCVPDEFILRDLITRFRMITIFFDNDLAGHKASKKLRQVFRSLGKLEVRRKFLPKRRFGYKYKDPAEFVSKEGRQDLLKIFKYMGLWQRK